MKTGTESHQGSVLFVSRPKQIAPIAMIYLGCPELTTFHLCPRGQNEDKNVSTWSELALLPKLLDLALDVRVMALLDVVLVLLPKALALRLADALASFKL